MTRWTITLSLAGTALSGISCRGDDLTAPTDSPAPAEGNPAFAAGAGSELLFRHAAAGYYHTCGVTLDGRAYCWGWNAHGQVGNGTTAFSVPRPTPVGTTLHFLELSAGFHHTCGLTTDNRIYCWGNNEDGELGDGTTRRRLKPVLVADGRHFRQVRAGFHHTCALTLDKRAYCWGRNTSGELGTGRGSALRPAAVAGGLRFFQITAGLSYTCGKTTDYRGFCWGVNDDGQLGDGTFTNWRTPHAVTGALQLYQVSAGVRHTCGLTSGNAVYCWGANDGGALGAGTNYNKSLVPVPVAGGGSFRQVAAGGSHGCDLTRNNLAYCWGWNQNGQLGDGTTEQVRWTPVPVAGGHRFDPAVGLTSGGYHNCGLGTDHRIYCWGWNGHGSVGDGTTTQRVVPVPVAGGGT